MADPKTVRTAASVGDFLAAVPDPKRRADALKPSARSWPRPPVCSRRWSGSGIVGFGSYHYRYASGREGDWPAVGMSPRKSALTIYVSAGFDDAELSRLGPHTTGKSCLYVKRLSDVDTGVLRELIAAGFRQLNGKVLTAERFGRAARRWAERPTWPVSNVAGHALRHNRHRIPVSPRLRIATVLARVRKMFLEIRRSLICCGSASVWSGEVLRQERLRRRQ